MRPRRQEEGKGQKWREDKVGTDSFHTLLDLKRGTAPSVVKHELLQLLWPSSYCELCELI